MQKRQLGTSEIEITPIIMGSWQAGKQMWVGIEDAKTVKAMRAAFEAGITTFDTAEEYGEGHSEQIIGQALSDVRSQVVYASKVFANHLKPDLVIEACDRSLKNLNTDYIDLYQIHWPAGTWNSELVPIGNNGRLEQVKRTGKNSGDRRFQLLARPNRRSGPIRTHRQLATAIFSVLALGRKRCYVLLCRQSYLHHCLFISSSRNIDR